MGFSTFPINSFSITSFCLSPYISAKHFTASRLSRASDAVTSLTSFSSLAISSSESLIKAVYSDWTTSAIPFSQHSCCQSTCVGSTAGSDVIVSASRSIYSSSVVSLEICANYSSNSLSITLIMIDISPTSSPHFLRQCLMVYVYAVLIKPKISVSAIDR